MGGAGGGLASSAKGDLKKLVAREALKYVEDGVVIGLGSGTTVREFIRLLPSLRLKDVKFVVTSSDTELAVIEAGLGHMVVSPWSVDRIDLAFDGADEVAEGKVLLKGGGGALLREKVVDYLADKVIIMVTEDKLVDCIPRRKPLPIEVAPFSWKFVKRIVEGKYGGRASLRLSDRVLNPAITDNGNYVLDWIPGNCVDPSLEFELKRIPGVVEVGIFSARRDYVVLSAKASGEVVVL